MSRPVELLIESPQRDAVERVELTADGPRVLGRATDCDVVLADDMASRRHASVELTPAGVRVADLGSANGVWKDGAKVGETILGPGEAVRVGMTTLRLAEPPARPAPTPASAPAPTPAPAPAPAPAVTPAPPARPTFAARPEPQAAEPARPAAPPAPSPGTAILSQSGITSARELGTSSFPTSSLRSEGTVIGGRPDPDALDLFADLGDTLEADGRDPFVISDPRAVWLVEEGTVDLFAVGVRGGRAHGSRRHYLRIETGQAFFGIDLESRGLDSGFLAVGQMGTRVRRLSLRDLRRRALSHPKALTAAVSWLDGWIVGLTKQLVRDMERPNTDVSLAADRGADEAIELPRYERARLQRGVRWADVEHGELLFLGMEELEHVDVRKPFPLTSDAWVEGSDEVEGVTVLRLRRTHEILARPELERALDTFHEVFGRCEFINKKLSLVDEFMRLRSKAAHADAAREEAVRELVAVLEPGVRSAGAVVDDDQADLVLHAMRRVGRAYGVEIRPHPEDLSDRTPEDRIAVYAKTSGVRVRKVALRDDWWRRDQGPILAELEEGGVPVALIPRNPHVYDLVDPRDGSKRKVTEKVALELAPFGHVIYRPFEVGALALGDLVRFGVRGLRPEFLRIVVLGVVLGVLGALTPYFTGRVFDSAIPEAERDQLAQLAGALLVAAIASAAFKLSQSIAVLRVQGKLDYGVQSALWDRLLDLPSGFFRNFSAGDLADRAAGVNTIRDIIAGVGVTAILGAFSSVFYVGLMFWYSNTLALLAIGLTLVFVSFSTAANILQLRAQRQLYDVRGAISGLVLQLVSAVSKLRIAGAEDHAFRVWADRFAEQRRLSFSVGKIQNVVAVFNSVFPIVSSIAIFSLVVYSQAQQPDAALTTGEFIAFSSAYALFLTAMQSLSDASLQLLEAVPVYERMKPILTTEPEVDEAKAYPGRLKGEIELSHLHFRYADDGPWTIKDVTLRIQPGEFVAFVGSSGSGKSTLMRLMLGFESPEKGSIYYDGSDLGQLDLREVRQQLGVVLQDSRVLPADIFRNIVGTSSRSLDEAWEAARMAGLDADIKAMPMGMHTYVSEGGGTFSGGQRQRLLIARALVDKPRILFMDEATSALDNKTQAIVTDSLDRLHATRIVIAHRLSTVRNADRICYLHAGEIVELGTYDELMEIDGHFAALARRQLV